MAETCFTDRRDAGRRLADVLMSGGVPATAVVIGLARGGVIVAAEVARCIGLPLDAVAVRKIGLPWQPERGIGAIVPDEGVYLHSPQGLSDFDLERTVGRATAEVQMLETVLRRGSAGPSLRARTVVLVDDALESGASMIAAARWARRRGAARVVVAAPVGTARSVRRLLREADEVICPVQLRDGVAPGSRYRRFPPVDRRQVLSLLDESRRAPSRAPARSSTRSPVPTATG